MKMIIYRLAAIVLCIQFAASAQAQSGFHLIKKTVIGGEGGWDYLSVDQENRRLFITHGTQVEVLNADTHEKVGAITDLKGVHGVLAVPGTGRGITTNGRSNTATIFDLKTLKPIVELPTGKNPDALIYDKFSKRVFIFNHSDHTATAIDVAAGKVAGTVDVGGDELEAGASDENGNIYVNLEGASEIAVFDAQTLKTKARWKISPGEEPSGLAIDVKSKRLFSVCHNEMMMVVDAENGKIISHAAIGKGVDGAAFDPETKLAFSSNGEGSITIVKESAPDQFTVMETIKTVPGARTMALDTKTHHVFVTAAQYGERPAATKENPNPRPKVVPGSFMVLEYGMK